MEESRRRQPDDELVIGGNVSMTISFLVFANRCRAPRIDGLAHNGVCEASGVIDVPIPIVFFKEFVATRRNSPTKMNAYRIAEESYR